MNLTEAKRLGRQWCPSGERAALGRNRKALLTRHSIARTRPPLEHSHHFHPRHPGVVSPEGRDFAGVVSNVAGPRLADDEGAVLLNGDSGAARWIYDNVVLLPNIPDCHSIADR